MKFEVDTGCSVTVFSRVEYGKLEVKEQIPKLKPSSLSIWRRIQAQSVNVLGTSKVQVKHNGLVKDLPVIVVAGSGPNLLGRSWLAELDFQEEVFSQRASEENTGILAMTNLNVSDWSLHA